MCEKEEEEPTKRTHKTTHMHILSVLPNDEPTDETFNKENPCLEVKKPNI